MSTANSKNESNTDVIDNVDLMDGKPPAKLLNNSSPVSGSNINDIQLSMADPEAPEMVPGDEEEVYHQPNEEYDVMEPAPEEAPSSLSDINKTTMASDENVDEEANSDGLIKSPAKKKKKKHQINPRYKDVHETGQWGDLTSKEFFVAIAAFVLVIVAVVLAVVFLVILPDDGSGSNGSGGNGTDVIVPAPTRAPTMPPKSLSPSDELALVLAAMDGSPFTATLLDVSQLPNSPTFYEGFIDDNAGTPQQKAMDWLLFQDELKDPEQSVVRFAFVSLYFQMDGPNWTSAEGWLSSTSICEWEHISCDSRGVLQEVDMDENNVGGNIPVEIALLSDTAIQSFLMSGNNISGSIPGGVFASLPRLGILYLNNNNLTGVVPSELVVEGRVHTLFVQGNELSGDWPLEYCADGTKLSDFGLDCDKLVCNPECCTPLECYYSS